MTGDFIGKGEWKGKQGVRLFEKVCRCGVPFQGPYGVTLHPEHKHCRNAAIAEGRQARERAREAEFAAHGVLPKCKVCQADLERGSQNRTCNSEECRRAACNEIRTLKQGSALINHPLFAEAAQAYLAYVEHCVKTTGRDIVETSQERWIAEWIEVKQLDERHPELNAPAEREEPHSYRCYYQYMENRVAA